MWLIENNYVTIAYGLKRTGEIKNYLDHIILPLVFLGKQIGILIPFFILFIMLSKSIKTNFSLKDQNLLYLLSVTLLPIFLMFLTSLIIGAKIRTMWMTPFYLFIGTLFIYLFQNKINTDKIRNFIYVFIFLFLLSPFLYGYISVTQTNKRTDYNGREIANLVERKLIQLGYENVMEVKGNEWVAGNLCYHLKSKPKCVILNTKTIISAENKNGPASFGLKELISNNYK